MALLNWSSKYSVGVKAMDDQHIALIEILNELHGAMLKGQALNVIDPLLKKLTDYVRTHFTTEEAMLESVKYPDLAAHREQHRALTTRLNEFIALHKKGDNTICRPLLNFLREWLNDHLLKQDKQFTKWANEHGIH